MHFWQICERWSIQKRVSVKRSYGYVTGVDSPCNSVSFHIFTRGCFVGFATPDPWKGMISPLHMLALDSDVCPTPVTLYP